MKARIERLDAFYEVEFLRPAFSRISSFVQIIEPIHDALSEELTIPSDAIRFENGDTIDTALVAAILSSPNCIMEARLNGYKAQFFDLKTPTNIDQAKRCMKRFETAVSGFLHDGNPITWRLEIPFWLAAEGGMGAIENMLRQLTWCSDKKDPFGINATATRSAVKFESYNREEFWSAGVYLDRAVLSSADMFVNISVEYGLGSKYNSFDDRVEHLTVLVKAILDALELIVE